MTHNPDSQGCEPSTGSERGIWSTVRRLFGKTYGSADRLVDRSQLRIFQFLWFFFPDTGLLKEFRFQQVASSRFLSDAGQQSLGYAALISVVRGGGSALDAAIVGVAGILPAAALGLLGSAVADLLPKRLALAFAYALQAALCVLVPNFVGTDLASIALLILAVNTLAQVSTPTESSILPYVATGEQLASANSLIGLAATAGIAVGTAFLAPILVVIFGVKVAFYVAGACLLLAANRVFDLPASGEALPRQGPDASLSGQNPMAMVRWLSERPTVATMLLVAVLAGTAQVVIQTLAPRFVVEVLETDAANSVYVFAPSAAGFVLALSITPILIRLVGERSTALGGFAIASSSLLLLGLIDVVAPIIAPVNPLRLPGLLGAELGERLQAASVLALPLGVGLALSSTAVLTYINRRVPLTLQGRTFAFQSSLKNAVAIAPLLGLGGIASLVGVKPVLIATPFVLLGLAYWLLQLTRLYSEQDQRLNLDIMSAFWDEPPDK